MFMFVIVFEVLQSVISSIIHTRKLEKQLLHHHLAPCTITWLQELVPKAEASASTGRFTSVAVPILVFSP